MTITVRALLILGALPSSATERTSETVEVTALAVTQTPEGLQGVHAKVRATVLAGGSGQVFVSTKPLAQTDMQGSARLASQVAAHTLGLEWRDYDFLVEFSSDSAVIGGPSAGGVMTLALATAIHNLATPGDPWSLDPTVAGTGTINPDGTIGPVGGVPAKAQAAKEAGITLFLYPAGLESAPTLQGSGFSARTVLVDMQEHCRGLGIECRPVAHVRQMLSASAGVTFEQAAPPATSTSDYGAVLRPSVEAMVARLEARVRTLEGQASGVSRIASSVGSARGSLDEASQALGEGKLYLAATRTFQGEIQAALAENLTSYVAAEQPEDVVRAALATCTGAVEDAEAYAYALRAEGMTALLAVAAAQERAAHSRALLGQAEQAYHQAFTVEDWLTSLHASAFCSARAGTASWWGGLHDAFGAGPAVADAQALAQQELEAAREMVTYAEAVGMTTLAEAQEALASAVEHHAAGRHAAAVLAAVNAGTSGAVAMQTGTGLGTIPDSVLAVARLAAERAVAQARAGGVEPVLSVSLLELAADQQGAAALESLWTARSLALLDAPPEPATTTVRRPLQAPDMVLPSMAMGAALGLAGAGTLLAAVAVSKRDR